MLNATGEDWVAGEATLTRDDGATTNALAAARTNATIRMLSLLMFLQF